MKRSKKKIRNDAPGKNDGDTKDDPDKDNNPGNGEQGDDKDLPEPTEKQKKTFKNWLKSFFAKAPLSGGAALEW